MTDKLEMGGGVSAPEGPFKAASIHLEVIKIKGFETKESIEPEDMQKIVQEILDKSMPGEDADVLLQTATFITNGLMDSVKRTKLPLGNVLCGTWLDGVLVGVLAATGYASGIGDIISTAKSKGLM